MRIGILTLPQETNYGGILQAFALQHTLRKMGHEPITVDRHNRREYPSLGIHVLGFVKRIFQHYIMHKDITVKWNPFLSDVAFEKSMSEMRKFVNRNMQMTYSVYSDQLQQVEDEYLFDAYVVGSDQVWLKNYCPNSFLDFVKREGVVKVIYAASCSSNSFFKDNNKIKVCAELAKQFTGISVREKQLIEQCQTYLGITPQWIIDPTMLLTSQEYLDAAISQSSNSPCIFTYILDENSKKESIIYKVKSEIGLPIVRGNNKTIVDGIAIADSVDKWLHSIYQSSFVVTDSFHGTVFAILFNKPFVSIVNKERGADRFISLLSMFGLESRLICEKDDIDTKTIIDNVIDYDKVNNILEIEKKKALSFLAKSLLVES